MSDPVRTCDGQGCENPASVHLTQVVDNKISVQFLCESCAEAKGISEKPDWGVSDFLAKLSEPGASPGATTAGKSCSSCSLTFDRFRERGRLGCPQCYTTFEGSLRRLLKRIHGANQHVGKVYLPPDAGTAEVGRRLDGLRRRLQHAVEVEDFERAAVLRDQIRDLEPAGS